MVSTSQAPANLSEDTFTQEPSQVLDDSNDLTLPDISLSGSNELPGLAHDLPRHQQQSVMNETSPSMSSTGPAGDLTTTLVSNGNDALRLLYQPAIENANKEGASPSNQGPISRHTLHRIGETSSPRTTASISTSRPTYVSPTTPNPFTVWRSFRFVRMGWFTAEEAVRYIDLFQQNLAPLSPVSRGFDLSHERHYRLITQEPLLCCVILMISSRYHVLVGHGGLARSTIIHHRLWEHCQHLVMRIIFGQEKRSKAKTRTRGSIEALLLIIEWHPQAIHLPPASDGWDSSTLLTDLDPRDDQFDNQADDTNDNEAQWLRDVILPAKTSDHLSSHACEDLTIEFNYLRAFMNSFGIQAAVDRVLGRRPPNSIDTDVLQSSITATDYCFIKEVINSSCQALESVNRLFEAGTLRYCPVRVFLRIIMASIFLLKALSLGIRTTDLETSLGILERSIRALRNSSLDEMHLASRYGELLDMHLERYRQSMVPTTIPQGIRTVDQTSQWIFDNSVPPVDDSLGDLSMPAVDDWLALPFDPSMAPFGFATDDPDMAEPEDRSWDFLWSLPNV
ncbi:hypothetical protein FocTR4_00002182 [Fusarium oxysporum f. sp. cubense]|uniref:Transcriptional activator ARO80 n=1 Tax=Fusarium oxysporum f. sp. cubense TaxID=61366 RepID=A0A5C6T1Q6_FUSOC|nr:hypothetical protein FocTR4_00002182 [Fusarium oxysporum f. sp. cubense]